MSNDNDIKKMISGDIPTIVYKTKKDYAKFVFVTMNKDKTKIISYPHPRDLNSNGKLLMPIELSNGYYLDQKGISENSVFTSITYEKYASLEEPLSISFLESSIIDKSPFIEFHICSKEMTIEELHDMSSVSVFNCN